MQRNYNQSPLRDASQRSSIACEGTQLGELDVVRAAVRSAWEHAREICDTPKWMLGHPGAVVHREPLSAP